MNFKQEDVLVLIPAFNEEKNIRCVIEAVRKNGFSVLAVDDGSSDRTVQEIRRTGADAIYSMMNEGKGAAIQKGFDWFLSSRYQALIIMDGDGQHRPEELDRFFFALQTSGADVILGDRMADRKGMSWVRVATNRTMSWLISRLARQNMPDTQCGYRALTHRAVQSIRLTARRYEAETEMLLLASKSGLKVASIPVSSVYQGEVSKISPVKDTIRFIQFLIRYSKNNDR